MTTATASPATQGTHTRTRPHLHLRKREERLTGLLDHVHELLCTHERTLELLDATDPAFTHHAVRIGVLERRFDDVLDALIANGERMDRLA